MILLISARYRKSAGNQQAAFRMIPAQQCFHATQFPCAKAGNRLIVEDKFIVRNGPSQSVLKRQALQCPGIHRRRIELVIVASEFFGSVHGGVGIFQQCLRILAVFRVCANQNAGADKELMTVNLKRAPQNQLQLVCNDFGIASIRFGQKNRKFVAAKPRHGVAFADTLRIRSPAARSNSSPTVCPRESLMPLKRSRSKNSTQTFFPDRFA